MKHWARRCIIISLFVLISNYVQNIFYFASIGHLQVAAAHILRSDWTFLSSVSLRFSGSPDRSEGKTTTTNDMVTTMIMTTTERQWIWLLLFGCRQTDEKWIVHYTRNIREESFWAIWSKACTILQRKIKTHTHRYFIHRMKFIFSVLYL